MGKPLKGKNKKAAAAAKRKEEEAAAAEEKAAVEDEYEFQKTCLEIRIKELETLNLGLQRKCEYLDSQNEVHKTQLEEVKEEKEDLVAHLQRCFAAEKTNVKELEDRLCGTQQFLLQEREEYELKLKAKDKTFEEMEEKLDKKIMDLDAQLTALEDFRIQRDKLSEETAKLAKTLSDERSRFARNYEELENNLIRYRERIKDESIQMVQTMAKDVQHAGKLCLTATVKSAISENIRLQEKLEQTSKNNLTLRETLDALKKAQREDKMTLKILTLENKTLHKKCSQYRSLTQELLDRQLLLERQLDTFNEVQNQLMCIKADHALCPSEQEIREKIEIELEKVLSKKKAEAGIQDLEDPKEIQLAKLEDLVAKMAIATKLLSQVAQNPEQVDFMKDNFKRMLVKLHEIACEIALDPNTKLSQEIRKQLECDTPKVLPFVSYATNK